MRGIGEKLPRITSVNNYTGDVVLSANDVGIKFYTLLFPANGWVAQDDGSYTQQVAVENILATDYAIVDIDMSLATMDIYSDLQDAWTLINRAQSVDGGVVLTAFDGAPEIDLTVKLEVIR